MAAKARLAVCISAFQYGGQGTVVEEELAWLRDEFDITLISDKIRRPVPRGVQTLETPSWSVFPRPSPSLVNLLRTFDLVHCHDSLGPMLAAKASGTPYIVTAMGIAPVRLRRNFRGAAEALITLLAYPPLYRSASSVVAISAYVANWARGFANVEPQVILLGAKEPNGHPYVRPTSRKLLYVGEISRRKGISALLRGLRAGPPDVSLDLVGAGDLGSFATLSRRLGVSEHVRFHGAVPEAHLWEMYRDAFCTVSASLWEGFGLPLVEGFRFGRPAIARRQGGLQEIVDLSRAGVLFQDPNQLGDRVEVVTEQWESFSKRAVDFARTHTWRNTFEAYRRLFNSTLNARTKNVAP